VIDLKTKKLKGIIPAVLTPFTEDGKLDEEGLRQNLNFLIKSGVHGLMVNGTTGEATNLSAKERKIVIETAVEEANGKIPVIAGTGSPSTWIASEATKEAKEAQADAAMIVTPYYLIPNEQGLIRHYETISAKVDIPIVIYNIPAHTNVSLTPNVVEKLCNQVSGIIAIKDSSGNVGQFAEMLRLLGKRISVLTGGDDLLLPSFALGSAGAIIALANIAPREAVKIFYLVQEGKMEEAREIYFKLLPIARAISSEINFPAPVKEAVRLLGGQAGPARSPIVPVSERERKSIIEALKHAGLL
jgi:4-hydroxy-tetrahydrodipicolinate synthase